MSTLFSQTGIQSWCFRHFEDNATVAQLIKKCGLARVELCGVHADFNKPETFAAVIDAYMKEGVQIGSIGVEGFRNNPAVEERRFEFCKAAGAKVISCDFDVAAMPDCLPAAVKLADKYDMRLAIHNHGGRHWLGSARMLEHIVKNSSERIGVCLDTAWALDSGEDPVAMVEQLGKRVYGIHLKDFIFDRARRPEDVVIGEGNLDLPRLLETLAAVGFNGSSVIEYEGDVENPVPALCRCAEVLRKS
jgi:inosose dehydratase